MRCHVEDGGGDDGDQIIDAWHLRLRLGRARMANAMSMQFEDTFGLLFGFLNLVGQLS